MLSVTEMSRSDSPSAVDRVEFYYPYSTNYGVSSYPLMSDVVNENMISNPVYVRKFSKGFFTGHEFQTYKGYNGFYKPNTCSITKVPFNKTVT